MSMMGPGGGGPPWRHLRSDRSVVKTRIERETLRRVLSFARAHRRSIIAFLLVTVVDAGLVVVPALLMQRLVDHGIAQGDTGLVVGLAIGIALVAVADSGLGLVGGYLSSRIGEGLIFDLRTRVFAHVQRQSLAFFTRTRTGALVSRLNSDVIGAQRAFTSTLSSVVGSTIALGLTLVVMLGLSWQVTVLALLLLPVFVVPARRLGNRLASLERETASHNAAMTSRMTERFSASAHTLVKLYVRPDE